jgi:hypothetical protein
MSPKGALPPFSSATDSIYIDDENEKTNDTPAHGEPMTMGINSLLRRYFRLTK